MTLDELQAQAAKDLKINDEHLDTESLKNQEIKAKYLNHKAKFELLDGVIKSIDNRGWDISHAIKWKQFEAGMV